MKINNLEVDGWGVWSGLELQALSPRVTVIFGANETGKTTLMQFIRSMFYGFSAERRARYLPPVHGGRPGGDLDILAPAGALRIVRHLDAANTPDEMEELQVLSPEGTKLSATLLDHLLAGVDEATFSNVFAVGLRELQELGTLDDTKAADLLYKLTTGLDRVSLIDVMRDLSDVRRKLYDPKEESCLIPELVQKREQLRERMEALAGDGRQWVELQGQLAAMEEQTGQLQRRSTEWEEQSKVLEVAIRVRELWCRRGELREQLAAIGELQEIPDTSLKRIEALRKQMEENDQQIAQLERRRREFRREVAAQPVNEKLWSQAARVEALVELGPWIANLQTQIEQMRAEMNGMQVRLSVSTSKLGLTPDLTGEKGPELSSSTLVSLQGPARAVRETSAQLKQAQAEWETAKVQLDDLTNQLETALVERGEEHLGKAVETAGEKVGLLRRREQLDERVEQLEKQWKNLQRDHQELLEDQVLKPGTLMWLGVPFVLGIAMLASGLYWSNAEYLGWPMALLGAASLLVAVLAKIGMERAAAAELDHCDDQLHVLREQITEARAELAEVEEQLPRRGGALEIRLSSAEKELAGLEELLPLEANVQAAKQRATAAQRRMEQAEAAVQESRTRWRQALRRLNLSEDMSPQAVKQLAEGTEQTHHSRRQLDIRREEYTARERELNTLVQRINDLTEQVQLNYSSPDPQVQLQRLSSALAEQQTLFERRQALKQEDRQVRRQIRSLANRSRQARAERRTIMDAAGARNEAELRRMLEQQTHRRSLQASLHEVSQQYEVALGKQIPVAQVEKQLTSHAETELEQAQATLLRQIGENRALLTRLHQRRGAIEQQSAGLLADRRMGELKVELGCVEQQLDKAVYRWRVLSVAARVLEFVRAIYETQRQPQTLQDASRYFKALTEGQYVRIWTPLSDMSLRVDMASGESLPLDVLSSGTREAVFLSLRLALVADFARRGIDLPLILDDVLVNFDRVRARCAANVLLDFAEHGHQVLMFTCHEHIVQLFLNAPAEIRYLSDCVLAPVPVAPAPPAEEADELPALKEAEPLPVLEEPAPEVEEEVEYDLSDAPDEPEDEDYALGAPTPVRPPAPLEFLFEPAEEEPEFADIDDEAEEEEDEIDDAEYEVEEEEEEEVEEEEEEDEEIEYEDAEYEDAVDEETAEEVLVSEPAEAIEQPAQRPRARQRFTWESPERWWDTDRSDEAA